MTSEEASDHTQPPFASFPPTALAEIQLESQSPTSKQISSLGEALRSACTAQILQQGFATRLPSTSLLFALQEELQQDLPFPLCFCRSAVEAAGAWALAFT